MLNNKRVVVVINNNFKGILVSIGKVLVDDYGCQVRFLANNNGTGNIIKNIYAGNYEVLIKDTEKKIKNKNVIKKAVKIEKKYSIKFSELISMDRAIGQGYLLNVAKIPHILRSEWSNEKKIGSIISTIEVYENCLNNCDIIISEYINPYISLIAKKKAIQMYAITELKYGDRYFWSNNSYLTSSKYIQRIKSNLKKIFIQKEDVDYIVTSFGNYLNESVVYNYRNAFKNALKVIWMETKNGLRKKRKKDTVQLFGWLAPCFRLVSNFKRIRNISIKDNEIKDYKIIFFPLHLEPEVALLWLSPEFTNSMEALSWISKSIPADYIIIVKEQNLSFAVRSKWYYKTLNKIGNIYWADPTVHSWDWIKKSTIVATITGTVGIESVYMGKPVISFGKHQIINYLPTVRYVDSYANTNSAVEYFIKNKNKLNYDLSKSALYKAQMESSFEIPNFHTMAKSKAMELEVARNALQKLINEYE